MRILTVGSLYPPYHLGGYELVWQTAVRALRDAGHEVRVLVTSDRLGRPDGAGEDSDVHRDLRWYWHDHEFPRLSLRGRLALERHNHAVMERHLGELEPDVVSWWAMGGMSLSLLERTRRAGIPSVGWVNDDWLLYGPRVDQWTHAWSRLGGWGGGGAVAGVPVGLDLPRAARWVFCSEATRRSAMDAYPDLGASAVHHQGVGPPFASSAPHEWRGRLIYAGRLDERKGLATLIDAVAGLPALSLRIVGDGDAQAAARLRARAQAAGRRITFEPGVDRIALARAYADADAVVFPVEWSEPWGLVPLEGMAVGRPVVATGRGGSAEYLEHERNALLFEAGSVAALQAALRRLAGDSALRDRLRTGGFQTAGRLTEAAWTRAVVGEHEALAAHARAHSAARRS